MFRYGPLPHTLQVWGLIPSSIGYQSPPAIRILMGGSIAKPSARGKGQCVGERRGARGYGREFEDLPIAYSLVPPAIVDRLTRLKAICYSLAAIVDCWNQRKVVRHGHSSVS